MVARPVVQVVTAGTVLVALVMAMMEAAVTDKVAAGAADTMAWVAAGGSAKQAAASREMLAMMVLVMVMKAAGWVEGSMAEVAKALGEKVMVTLV